MRIRRAQAANLQGITEARNIRRRRGPFFLAVGPKAGVRVREKRALIWRYGGGPGAFPRRGNRAARDIRARHTKFRRCLDARLRIHLGRYHISALPNENDEKSGDFYISPFNPRAPLRAGLRGGGYPLFLSAYQAESPNFFRLTHRTLRSPTKGPAI